MSIEGANLSTNLLVQVAALEELMLDFLAETLRLLGEADMHLQQAREHQQVRNFTKASEHASEASRLHTELGMYERQLSKSYKALLLVTNDSNQHSRVKLLSTLAIELENHSIPELAGEIFADLAAISLQQDDYEQAHIFATDALSLLTSDHPARGTAHQTLALCHFHKQQ